MLKNIGIIILLIISGWFLWNQTPLSNIFYYEKAKKLYMSGQYTESIPILERVLKTSADNSAARIMYVQALSKLEPTYSVQKKLYKMSESEIDDSAKDFAKSQTIQIKHKLLEGIEDNYIYNAVSGKDIIHWDVKKFPITIYYETTTEIPEYYVLNIQKAFDQWAYRADFLKFKEVSSKKDANIYISFKDIPSDICDNDKCVYTVGYTDTVTTGKNILERMNLTFYKTNPAKTYFSELEIYNTALHEIGHTLGIMGHSDNSSDVMHSSDERVHDIYAAYRSELQDISMNDLRTLALLYKIAPTISNTKNIQDENMYYGPLILGSNNELLEKKLNEHQRYIDKYPHLSAGYINISSVYSDFGDISKALENLEIAESKAQTADEKYLINYNKAVIYFNKQDFENSLIYAKKAKAINSTPNIEQLINDIENIKSK